MSISVEISDSQLHLPVDRPGLEALVRRVLEGQGITSAMLSIALVDDASIHAINRRHLDHDWPTDVITFPLSDPDDDTLEAELVVSVEMATTTAREAGTDPRAELSLYVVHGLLHLCGYDDRSEESAREMRIREDEVLRREGIFNTFSSVSADSSSGRGGERCPA